MKEEQDSLRANFGSFMQVLETLDGGMPDVHIGVTTLGHRARAPSDGTTASARSSAATAPATTAQLRTAPTSTGRSSPTTATAAQLELQRHARRRVLRDRERRHRRAAASSSTSAAWSARSTEPGQRRVRARRRVPRGRRDRRRGRLLARDTRACSTARPVGRYASTSRARAMASSATSAEHDDARARARTAAPNDARALDRNTRRSLRAVPEDAIKRDPRDVVVAGIVGDTTPFAVDDEEQRLGARRRRARTPGRPATRPRSRRCARPTSSRSSRTALELDDLRRGSRSRAWSRSARCSRASSATRASRARSPTSIPRRRSSIPTARVSDVKRVPGGGDVELDVISACSQTANAPPCWRVVEDAVNCSYTHTDPHLKLVIDRGGAVVDPAIHIKASCVTVDPTGSQF